MISNFLVCKYIAFQFIKKTFNEIFAEFYIIDAFLNISDKCHTNIIKSITSMIMLSIRRRKRISIHMILILYYYLTHLCYVLYYFLFNYSLILIQD
jgi:hypothetical protein